MASSDQKEGPRGDESPFSDYVGQLPSPELLAAYEKISPGFSEQLLRMVEAEAQHRRELEDTVLEASARETRRGQLFSLSIALCSLIAGVTLTAQGAEVAGGIIGSAGIIGVVAIFVLSRVLDRRTAMSKDGADDSQKGAK
ncbi:DUF2335 domain-containing protein [Vreelandella titanicae]|uniref:DUF2335 domain-containing protein n=1 Tax=Vreelandella titanicae TaxID=664683 RepID=UPI003D2C5A24